MSLKFFKKFFILVIILLTISGIYIVYIKDNKQNGSVQAKNREIKISKEINIGITNFDTANPILTKNLEIQHITKLVYEPLINITQDFQLSPGLAEEWSKLDDLTYLIKLDETKKWSNGEKLTVEDIENTIEIIKDSDTIYKENIKQISNIEKIDENTFKIHLNKAVDFFEYLLCFPIVKENTENPEIPINTGEYKISNIKENEITVEGKDLTLIIKNYKNATELYNSFTKGNVDLIITSNTNYEKYITTIGFDETIIVGREFYYISCENIKDIQTREYLESLINKHKLVYDLYNQKYFVSDFPLQYGSYLNIEKNKKEETKTISKKNFTLSTEQENKEIAEKIQEQFKEKDINLQVQTYKNSKADMILKKATVSITPEIYNYFESQEIKQEIKQIAKIENKEILKEKYQEIIEKCYNTTQFIGLYFNTYIILHTNSLKGDFTGNWYNMFYNVNTWYKIL